MTTELIRLLDAGTNLSFIGDTQRLGVSQCVDPAALDDGGVPAALSRLLDYYVLYAGAGVNAEPLAIVHVDQVGRPGTLVRARAKSIVELEPGACTYDPSADAVNVASTIKLIEAQADRQARRKAVRYERRRVAAVAAGDPPEVLAAWAQVTS